MCKIFVVFLNSWIEPSTKSTKIWTRQNKVNPQYTVIENESTNPRSTRQRACLCL